MGLKAADMTAPDSQANQATIRCLSFTVVPFAAIWLLAMLNIFSVEKSLMTVTFLVTSAVLLTPQAICRVVGTEKPWIKYMILFALAVALTMILCLETGRATTSAALILAALLTIFASERLSGMRTNTSSALLGCIYASFRSRRVSDGSVE